MTRFEAMTSITQTLLRLEGISPDHDMIRATVRHVANTLFPDVGERAQEIVVDELTRRLDTCDLSYASRTR